MRFARCRRCTPPWLVAVLALHAAPAVAALSGDQEIAVLGRMSLEELSQLEVTSVSKSAQVLSGAAASIYVIMHEEIARSGVLTVPDALRLAPNLQVLQLGARSYAITARGFGDHREVQTQSNKLLVLVDGRAVYSPIYSGVLYEGVDVLLEDVDRIEVISGPGASLWGANAMNGVINIITRSSEQTQGSLVRLSGGDRQQAATARWGGMLGERTSFRVYGRALGQSAFERAGGSSAADGWARRQGGFRLDSAALAGSVTVQLDTYGGELRQGAAGDFTMSGANLLGRWRRSLGASELIVQAYYDQSRRGIPVSGIGFTLDTVDVEFQHALPLGERQRVVWGGGYRLNDYRIRGTPTFFMEPAARASVVGNLFAQDTIALGRSLQLTAGVKLESNAYRGWTALPDLRLAYTPRESFTLWAAASRAIRSPTPFDVEVREKLGSTLFLVGDPDFRSESVRSLEVGYRGQPTQALSLSVAAFYGRHDRLRSIEPAPGGGLPLRWGNGIRGATRGIEAWADLQVRPWWRLSPGYRSFHSDLEFAPGASRLVGLGLAGNDPRWQASLKSSMDLPGRVTLDLVLRHTARLPGPVHPAFDDLSGRVAWQATPALQVALAGFGLFAPRHGESPPSSAALVPRTVLLDVRWTP